MPSRAAVIWAEVLMRHGVGEVEVVAVVAAAVVARRARHAVGAYTRSLLSST
jgi:hypothetical protein